MNILVTGAFVAEIAALLGWRKLFVPLARPFARASMLKLSPYLGK